MITKEPIKEKQKELSLGFIGVGWIGRNRMEVLLKNRSCRAIAIREPFQQNADAALQCAKTAKIIENEEEMYKNASIDGIVIATPSALHAQQSIAALTAGKAVFCQKPLGRTVGEVKEIIAASKAANKLLTVDLSYRYTQAFQAVSKLIKNKEIGDIFAVDLCFHNAYGPDKEWFYDVERSGGGCVMDLGIHLVDMVLWCLGFPEIREVKSQLYAKGKKLRLFENAVEDYASVSLITTDNTTITLQCSWHISAGQDAVIEAKFYGTKGGAAVKNVNGSFYDFTAERYRGTQKETIINPPDDWSGRAGLVWADALLEDKGYDAKTADEFIKTAQIIDRIYGR